MTDQEHFEWTARIQATIDRLRAIKYPQPHLAEYYAEVLDEVYNEVTRLTTLNNRNRT